MNCVVCWIDGNPEQQDEPRPHVPATVVINGQSLCDLHAERTLIPPPPTRSWVTGEEYTDEQRDSIRANRLLHSVADVGTQLGGSSRSRVYELIAAGELETVSIGRRTFVTGDSLVAYVERLRYARSER
jgi:hypothetical protein